jgi:hypothetical protein
VFLKKIITTVPRYLGVGRYLGYHNILVPVPQELPKVVEEALVRCLETCAEFNFPMRKKNLQDLVQAYCVENGIKTRWVNDRPAKDWVISFTKRWSHRVKVRKPTNIRRSRAKVRF